MTGNDQIAVIQPDNATDYKGSKLSVRHFQKPPFTTGVIVSESVACFQLHNVVKYDNIFKIKVDT